MSADEVEPQDEQFADLLAAYENALVAGAPSPAAVRPPPELQKRLQDALSCVHMLQQLWPAPATAETDPEPRFGERYQQGRPHAGGGVGQVWLVYDTVLQREVALKELRAIYDSNPVFARRLLHEARITGRLQHPGIVPVYELVPGHDGEPGFYTMRFVQGRTLGEAITAYHQRRAAWTAGPLDLNALLGAFAGVCHTVAFAHAQGVIHRDLKSANVVLGDFGEVVLLDWGFAKELGQPDEEPNAATDGASEPAHTLAGQVVGTPAYMAPEQAAGQRERIDRRSDVYGLGAILYEILTGRPPFVGNDTRELLRQARDAEPLPPQEVCAGIAPGLAAVCRRALARDPQQRYASARELVDEIQRWLADEPVQAYRETPAERLRRWSRRHKPLVAGLVALVVTTLAAATIALVLLEREQARTAQIRVQAAAERASADAAARDALESHLYVERIALAERELAAHNLARATQLVDECSSERRGWEWACLQRQCHTDMLVVRGHEAPLAGAVLCRNGTRLVTAGHDHLIKLWDAATGRHVATLSGHDDVIHCLAASPDGARFATGSWDKTAKVWDADGRLLHTLSGHPGIVIRVAFSADGRRLASVSDQAVKLWDVNTGREVRMFEEKGIQLFGLALSPDGRLLATGEGGNLIKLWDINTGAVVRVLRGHRAHPKHLAFSPDGRLLAAGDGDTLQGGPGVVKIWDVAVGTEVFSLQGHTYPVFAVAFSADGTRLFSGSQDNSIKVWDVRRGQLVLTLRGHSDVVRSLYCDPGGRRLVSASADRSARIWDATPWTEDASNVRILRGHEERVIGVGCTADGKRVASLSYDAVLRLWDADSGRVLYSGAIAGGRGAFHAFDADKHGKLLALGASSGAIMLIDGDSGKQVGLCPGFGAGPVKGVAFSHDGKWLAAGEWRNTARIWDVRTRQPLHRLRGHTEPVVAVAFSADDRLLASGSHDQTVKLWETATGKDVATLRGHTSQLTALAFGPDVLASAANDGAIKFWDPKSGKELRELRGHTGAVGSLAFSPDGRLLASASDDWTVKLWNGADGSVLQTLRGHTGAVRTLVFTPDGERLVSGSQDGTVRCGNLGNEAGPIHGRNNEPLRAKRLGCFSIQMMPFSRAVPKRPFQTFS